MKVLHILEGLSGAGPTRSLLALARYQRLLGMAHEHRCVTLRREAYPLALVQAKQAGVAVLRAPDPATVREQFAWSDVVEVHFWNSPGLWAFLREEWPPVRLLIRCAVLGVWPPQVVTAELVGRADWFVATNPLTLALPVLQKATRDERTAVVPGVADFGRLADFQPRPHDTFNVGYIGTVNFTKMHPDFVALSARIAVPGVRIVVCGGGQEQLRQEADRLGVADRFELRGFVENIREVLETLDVFGYPLCPDTYATSDLVLQEAMYAGVPPVILPFGGPRNLVQDGQTGLVAASPEAYPGAIEYLYRHPAERARLGQTARAYARQHFAPEGAARRFDEIYRQMMDLPRRGERWAAVPGRPAAELFVSALGDSATPFSESLAGPNEGGERLIAASSYLLGFGEGGVLHYRNSYPQDPHLRLWAGLVLLGHKRLAEAGREFQAAVDRGLDPTRARPYLREAEGG
jgi:glycosyltransferase involved in cell wall biosynthesis